MTQSTPRIAVLVSIGRHPVSGVPRWSRNDARALDLAYSLAASPADVDVIHAGRPQPEVLRDYLALGVKTIQVLDAAPDADIVPILAERVQSAELVICGMRAEGQDDSGMVPYLLARKLKARLLPGVLQLNLNGNHAAAVQFLPKGRRRQIEAAMPCVVTAHPLAPLGLKYAHANKLAGHIVSTEAQSGSADQSPWTIFPVEARPVRLAAREKRSGHARMLSSTTTESRAGMVMDQGSTQEKAAAVITYLRKHGLIDY